MVRTALLAVVLMLTAAAAARAGEVARVGVPAPWAAWDPEGALRGPVLAGDRVVWAQGADAGPWTIRAVVPGGAPATVATLPLVGAPGYEGDEHGLVLFGSSTRLAWYEGLTALQSGKYQFSDPRVARIVAGPPGGPFARVAGCDRVDVPACARPCIGAGAFDRTPFVALTGDTLVHTDECGESGTGSVRVFRITDLAADPPVQRTLPEPTLGAGDFPVAAAGGLVAVRREDDRVEVVGLADGAPAGAYPSPFGTRRPDASFMPVAMQPDGKLAGLLQRPGSRGATTMSVQWRAPGDPVVHALGLKPAAATLRATPPQLQIAGDRIVARVARRDGGEDLVVSDLTGHAAPILHLPAGSATRQGARVLGLAFDGARIAWAVGACERTTIGLSRVGDAPSTFAGEVCATPRVVSTAATVGRDGRFRLQVTCRRGCRGKVVVGEPGGLVVAPFDLGPSTTARPVRVRATRALRRALAHSPSYSVSAWIAGAPWGGVSVPLRATRR